MEAQAIQPVDGALSKALHRLLRMHWGHKGFRPSQLEAIAATLQGKDVLLVLPTGAGKSITFQLAPIYRNTISVVITPLLALGKDQVERCLELGIEAALWSSDTPELKKSMISRELLADYEDTSLRLLYTTPESLCKEQLRDLLLAAHQAGKLCSIAVDESHCCSEWGHDFRPAYLNIGEVRELFKGVPCIAVTATATHQVRNSIIELLRLRSPVQLVGSFNRPNIEYRVGLKEAVGDGTQEAVVQDLLAFVRERPGQCGIIYARLRKTCDWLASELCGADIEAAAYHAGKDAQQRSRIQSGWSEGAYDVVVATIAFGMGIDKAEVRYVIHFDPPASVEGFYQESGRAGRDGEPCTSLLYASNKELSDAKKMEKSSRQGSTAAVASIVQEAKCRRRGLLAYFGEKRGPCDPAAGDVPCDFCRNPQAVRSQLSQVQRKLEAAAEKERQPSGDPYELCDAGSGGKAAAEGAKHAGGSGGSSVEGGGSGEGGGGPCSARAPDIFRTAFQMSASKPGAAVAAAAATRGATARVPTLGLQRARPPQARLPAAADGPAASTSCSMCGEQEGSPDASPGAQEPAATATAAVAEAAQPGLKRPPLKPLLPNRFKRPAMAPTAAAAKPAAEQPGALLLQRGEQLQPNKVLSGHQTKSPADVAAALQGQGCPIAAAGAGGMAGGLGPQPAAAPKLAIGLKHNKGGFKPPLMVRPPPK